MCRIALATSVLLFTLLAFISSNALAEVFQEVPGQKFHFDMDTRDGAFSEWRHDDLASVSALRATLEFQRLGKHEKWLPGSRILVTTSDGDYGISLTADHSKPPMRMALVRKEGWGTGSIKNIAVGERITIEMDWSHSNLLLIRLGDGQPYELALTSPVKGLYFSASTGELTVHSLVLGRMVP